MIFVAVGTQKFQMNRLLRNIDEMIDEGVINEPVFAQIGNSDYIPKNYDYLGFLDKKDFENKINECALLLTHSGVATIIAGLKREKPVIVVPRLAKFGEHVDDHQIQIAESFSQQNLVLMCSENDDLLQVIENARTHSFSKYKSQRNLMLQTVRNYLDKLYESL